MSETALPATGELHPDAVRSEVGRAMSDAAHPQHAAYEQATKYGNKADWERWRDDLYQRLPGASAPVLAGQKIGAVEIGGGIEVRTGAARPLGQGETPTPGAELRAAAESVELEALSPDVVAADEAAFAALRHELGADVAASTIEIARDAAQAMVREHGIDAVNDFLGDYFACGGTRESGIKFLARYGKRLTLK